MLTRRRRIPVRQATLDRAFNEFVLSQANPANRPHGPMRIMSGQGMYERAHRGAGQQVPATSVQPFIMVLEEMARPKGFEPLTLRFVV